MATHDHEADLLAATSEVEGEGYVLNHDYVVNPPAGSHLTFLLVPNPDKVAEGDLDTVAEVLRRDEGLSLREPRGSVLRADMREPAPAGAMFIPSEDFVWGLYREAGWEEGNGRVDEHGLGPYLLLTYVRQSEPS